LDDGIANRVNTHKSTKTACLLGGLFFCDLLPQRARSARRKREILGDLGGLRGAKQNSRSNE